jgi:hypothetical protein
VGQDVVVRVYLVFERKPPIFKMESPPNLGLSVFQGFLLITLVAFDLVGRSANSF